MAVVSTYAVCGSTGVVTVQPESPPSPCLDLLPLADMNDGADSLSLSRNATSHSPVGGTAI